MLHSQTLEFILIRRDQLIDAQQTKMRDFETVEVENKVSDLLSHKRLLLAREFSKMLTGEIHVSKYFNNTNANGAIHFEAFLNFCIKFIHIACHRRASGTINFEIQIRLFRSNFFNKLPDAKNELSKREQQILYGRNEPQRKCYYHAISPLISEILKVNTKQKELLWIGETKYMG